MFKFLFITFVIIYIFYKISTFLLNTSQNFDSKKKKNDGILDKEGEYVDYEELD